jgi:hypothetical protein
VSFRYYHRLGWNTPAEEHEAGEITYAASRRHVDGDRSAAETCDVEAVADVVVAILEVLTSEQRARILEKLK